MLDESHVGKNAENPTKDLRSEAGKKILELVNLLDQGKIVFSTATPASHSLHLGVMDRVGLWGANKYFKSFRKLNSLMRHWYVHLFFFCE